MDLGLDPRIRASVSEHLGPGETIQAAFPAMAVNWALFAAAIGIPLGFGVAFSPGNPWLGAVLGSATALAVWGAMGAGRDGSVFRIVVATDRRILLFTTAWWSSGRARSPIGEWPRATTIGPHTGIWYRTEALGDPLWIHRRFAGQVAVVDAAVG
jgi:hypothetical protein